MNCPHHPRNEVTGYCSVCGAFGCDECLTRHEGNLLCQKHYRPIAEKLAAQRKHDLHKKRQLRQRLVVRFKDGTIKHGVCFALNPKEKYFHLDLVDSNCAAIGESEQIRFADLKAVFYVKSFDGNYDKSVHYRDWTPEGSALVVEFEDGEVIRGYSLLRYDPDEPRFFLVPEEEDTNNISILVEKSAVTGVYTEEEYKEKQAREKQTAKEQEVEQDLSHEETLGDFYFETRNYETALENYALALQRFSQSRRLKKKILTCKYNIGVGYIKRREYAKALACIEEVLKADPRNSHALKKQSQLRKILERENKTHTGPRDRE